MPCGLILRTMCMCGHNGMVSQQIFVVIYPGTNCLQNASSAFFFPTAGSAVSVITVCMVLAVTYPA